MADVFIGDDGWDPEFPINGWVHQKQKASLGRFYACHTGKLFVAMDGACRDNGKSPAKATIGVYFGPGNTHNRAEMLVEDPDITWTSPRAELWAACRAVHLVTGMMTKACRHCRPALQLRLDTVSFKSDSAYVVRGITDFYMKWQAHDWKNALGSPVANKDLWVKLYHQVRRLQRFGISVAYWQVERLHNQAADQLAQNAIAKQLPAVYPYPKTRKRKREDGGASSMGLVWVDTSTTSDPVWKYHHALAHLELGIFKRTLRFYGHINDITEADVQAKIDSNERCQSCFARGATDAIEDEGERDEPVAKRARVSAVAVAEPPVSVDASMVDSDSTDTLDFARGFEFDFERPSGVVSLG